MKNLNLIEFLKDERRIGCISQLLIDGLSIMAVENQIKILAWYDNEWAYASRVVELAQLVDERMRTAWKSSLTL